MYYHEIEQEVDALIAGGFIQQADKKEATKHLKDTCWTDRVGIVWGIDDVQGRAEEIGVECDIESARGVLTSLMENHDANFGVNWDAIDIELE